MNYHGAGKESSIKKWMGWIFGLIIVLSGLSILTTGSLGGIFFIMAGTVFLPPVIKFLEEKKNIKLTLLKKIGLFLLLIIIGSIFYSPPSGTVSNTTPNISTNTGTINPQTNNTGPVSQLIVTPTKDLIIGLEFPTYLKLTDVESLDLNFTGIVEGSFRKAYRISCCDWWGTKPPTGSWFGGKKSNFGMYAGDVHVGIIVLRFDSVDNATAFWNKYVSLVKEVRGYTEISLPYSACFGYSTGSNFAICQKENIFFSIESSISSYNYEDDAQDLLKRSLKWQYEKIK